MFSLRFDQGLGAGLIYTIAYAFLCISLPIYAQEKPGPGDEVNRGIGLYKAGSDAEAVKVLGAALKKRKDSAEGWHFLGLAQFRVGNGKEARKAFEKAAKLRPDFAPTHTSLAFLRFFVGDLTGAEREATQSLSLDAENAPAHYIIGSVRLRSNKSEEALREAETAVKIDQSYPLAYFLKTQALVNLFARERAKTMEIQSETSGENQYELLKTASESLKQYLKLQPKLAETELWREQLETLQFYANRVHHPEQSQIFSMSASLRPKILYQEKARYTEQARNAGVQGSVKLLCAFADDGTIKHVIVLQALSHGLTEEALRAMRKIKFAPAMKEGKPISVIGTLEYSFNLY